MEKNMQERLSLPVTLEAASGEGIFEGYASVFDAVDRDGDIVRPGAFRASLQQRLPALLWQHDPKAPIGKFLEVKEDNRGLWVRGQLSLSGRGREAYDLLQMGALDGLSIGFVAKEAGRDKRSGGRVIVRAELMEISLVTFPANELARIETVKEWRRSGPEDDMAHFLQSQGVGADRAFGAALAAEYDGGLAQEDMNSDLSESEIDSLIMEMESKTRSLRLSLQPRPAV